MSLSALLSEALLKNRDRTVLVTRGRVWLYSDLEKGIDTLSARLKKSGCGRGSVLIAKLDSGIEFLSSFLAALSLEAVFVPFSGNVSPQRLEEARREFGATCLLEKGSEGEVLVTTFSKEPETSEYRDVFKEGGLVRFTSGTTGVAKGVFVSFPAAFARVQGAMHGLELPREVALFWPLEMASHFIALLPAVLLQGGCFVLPYGDSPKEWAETLQQSGATGMYAAPFHYQKLLELPVFHHHLKRALSTTAPLAPSIGERFRKKFSVRVDNVYGIFEVGLVAAQNVDVREGAGRVLPGVEVAIRGEGQESLSSGEVGRVFLKSEGLLSAYLRPLKIRPFSAGWFETGDIGTLSVTEVLTIVGRKASIIVHGDARIYPEQVEASLLALNSVVGARVVKSSIPHGGVVAEVVVRPGCDLIESEIRGACAVYIVQKGIPLAVKQVAAIPLTKSGKILRDIEIRC